MSLDRHLLDILCCPVSKLPVAPLGAAQLQALNREIEVGAVLTVSGEPVTRPLEAALLTQDRKLIYRVEDGIPVMLGDAAIATVQLQSFPT